jgi:hypothetical protein
MSARELRTLIRDEILLYLHLRGGTPVRTRNLHLHFHSWYEDPQDREFLLLHYTVVFERLIDSGVIHYHHVASSEFTPTSFVRLR